MKKIAIIIDGDLVNRKGQVNASLNRIKYLKQIANYEIDVFAIQVYEGFLTRFLRKNKRRDRIAFMEVDGIRVSILWKKFSLINYILTYIFKRGQLFSGKWENEKKKLFKSYSIISAHSIACARLALAIHKQYDTPYYVTWHGSDIHTLPYLNRNYMYDTVRALEGAKNNFFVSNALLQESKKITKNIFAQVLYNGVGTLFTKYSEEERLSIRRKWNVAEKKVVAFVGNLFPIKNVTLLPGIFSRVNDGYHGNVVFWIIGDGKQHQTLQESLNSSGVEFKMWGNQDVNQMPLFMNVIDVLLLPSKNEGLPLALVEALACGANAVGSDVGGIPEILGKENVFQLDDQFEKNISERIVRMLTEHIDQPLAEIFDWASTARLENEIYNKELSR